MPFHGAAILFGQTTPTDEAHHPSAVKKQNRGALAVKGPEDGIQGGVIDFPVIGGAMQPVGKLKQRRLLGGAPHSGFLSLSSLGDFRDVAGAALVMDDGAI